MAPRRAVPDGGAGGSLRWVLAQMTGRLWFRVSLFAVGAVVTALLAVAIAPLVPAWVTERIGERATWDVLSILASSMLVVATFSLGTLVQAYAAAASTATPRATRILIDDPFSQNVLATFLGAFVFAMAGLVALGFGYYSLEGRTVLLVAAGLVILIVITTFFAWLDHLSNMVRLGETLRKIEARAEHVLQANATAPRRGGVAPDAGDRQGHPVSSTDTLYVVHVDLAALEAVAARAGGRVWLAAPPGVLAGPTRPLARTSWPASEAEADAIRRAFARGTERDYDEDPRFCLEVITEVGSRALSPGINDPGTAIAVLAALQRLLSNWALTRAAAPAAPTPYPHVAVDTVPAEELFDDAFGPLAREAAGTLEVGLRLQKTLAALAELGPPGFAEAARASAARALAHADAALPIEADRLRLAAAATLLQKAIP